MFVCANCGVVTLPRVASTPIITQTRKVQYLNNIGEPISKGTEIVKEIRVCEDCADEFPKEMRG